MKKIFILSLIFLACLTLQSQAQTYLIDLYQSSGNEYTGDASTDFGISGTVTDVGGSNTNSGYGTNTPDDTYTLGAVGTLTLNSGYFTYNGGGSGADQTSPLRLTESLVAAGGPGAEPQDLTLDLSGLPTGDTVTISALGYTGNNGASISVNGGTAVVINAANSDGTGTFTTLLTGGTATSYSIVASSPNIAYTGDEGDITAFLVTINSSTPEPVTWALMLGGVGALMAFQKLRRRQA